MAAGFAIDHYDWAGGREAMLRFGPDRGPVILVAPPLFEEANRTRATIVAMLAALAGRGIAGALPDLPGQGESPVATRDARLADWQAAFAAAAAALERPVHVVAVRGGALVDAETDAASRWSLAPVAGEALVRELHRLRLLAEGEDDLFGGNELAPDLVSALAGAAPVTAGRQRVVRLAGDPRPADRVLAFAPPWRTAEPQRDEALAAALADDIAGWTAACAG